MPIDKSVPDPASESDETARLDSRSYIPAYVDRHSGSIWVCANGEPGSSIGSPVSGLKINRLEEQRDWKQIDL